LAGIAGPTVQDYVVNTLGEDLPSFYFCKLHLGSLEVAKNVFLLKYGQFLNVNMLRGISLLTGVRVRSWSRNCPN
jgi:hypothetical protein